MKPLESKLTSIVIISTLLLGSLGGFTAYTFWEIRKTNKQINYSIELIPFLNEIQNTKATKTKVKKLQSYRTLLDKEKHQEYLSDVIQSYNVGNKRLLRKRIKAFHDYQDFRFKHFKKQLAYLEKKLLVFSSLLFLSMLSMIFFTRHFVYKRILNPLKYVLLRMMEFLNGQYTYRFETPSNDEMGELQSTFNSMAQTVLHNLEELKELDEAKSEFLNIASHELRTPMTSIKGSLGLLSSGKIGDLPADMQDLIYIAETETNRLIRLTNDILDMAKIEAGKMPLHKEWVPLENIVHSTVQSLQGLLTHSQVKINIQPLFDLYIYADSDKIQQVLTNLLSNAIKFSPDSSTIEIFTNVTQDHALSISVKDQGRGMSPSEKNVIFQKFRQASSPDKLLVKGTGLGLSIAKALVEQHEGEIGVESKTDEGSTFYFTLAKWKESPSDQQEIAS